MWLETSSLNPICALTLNIELHTHTHTEFNALISNVLITCLRHWFDATYFWLLIT